MPPHTKPRKKLADLLGAAPTFQVIDGQTFVRVRDASKVAALHPMVIDMGKEMLASIGGKGTAYPLLNQTDKLNKQDIARLLLLQLRKFAKVMEPSKKLNTHAVLDPTAARIVCWYSSRP